MIKYVVSADANPEVWDSVFPMWDTQYDIGYEFFEFDLMEDGISIFDTPAAAVQYAKEVLREVWEDTLYVLAVDTGTEQFNLYSTITR
jgi:hypothetical protein